MLDVAVIGLVTAVVGFVIGAAVRAVTGSAPVGKTTQDVTGVLIGLGVGLLYFTSFIGRWGQTPGKRLAGIKVVSAAGGRLGYPRALLRWVGYYVSFLLAFVGFMMIGWDRDKRSVR